MSFCPAIHMKWKEHLNCLVMNGSVLLELVVFSENGSDTAVRRFSI